MTARTRQIVGLLVLMMVAPSAWAQTREPEKLMDFSGQGFRLVAFVGQEYFSPAYLEEVFERERHGSPRAFLIEAFGDRASATIFAGKGRTEVDYPDWERMYYARSGHDSLRAMELIAIGNDSVIRVRDGRRLSRLILEGKDPTIFTVGPRSCELLQLRFTRLPRPLNPGGENTITVHVTLKTDILPNESEAKEITQELVRRLQYPVLNLNIRTDTWFIDDSSFPAWFPFSNEQGPRDAAEYRAKSSIHCFAKTGAIRCVR